MERSEILEAMGGLKLFGMRAAYGEIVATAVKRQHDPQRVAGDLLSAELSEKQARSIKYQIAVAKLPVAKEIEDCLQCHLRLELSAVPSPFPCHSAGPFSRRGPSVAH